MQKKPYMKENTKIDKNYNNYYIKVQQIFVEISNIIGNKFGEVIKTITLNRNEYLLKEGDYCRNFYFMKSGILRNYYIKNGIEIITNFTFPSDLSTILRSIIVNEPSREYIQAITDCEILSISISEYQKLVKQYSKIAKIDTEITQLYAILLEDRLYSLQFHTAAERYEHLVKREPFIVKQVPLTYIASYLGITLETLSRIRAKK